MLSLLAGSMPVDGQETTALETNPETPASSAEAPHGDVKSRWLVLSADEISHYRAIAEARQQRRESYIRATEDDDVVLLEPYIVEGDYSLTMARIRRDLEKSFRQSHSTSVALQDPGIQRELLMAQKHDSEFFRGRSPGAPEDHVRAGVDLKTAPGTIIDAFRNHRPGDLFRSPEAGAQE